MRSFDLIVYIRLEFKIDTNIITISFIKISSKIVPAFQNIDNAEIVELTKIIRADVLVPQKNAVK